MCAGNQGRVFCFLPLPLTLGLHVHVNGKICFLLLDVLWNDFLDPAWQHAVGNALVRQSATLPLTLGACPSMQAGST